MARWLSRVRNGRPAIPSTPRRLTTDPCNKVAGRRKSFAGSDLSAQGLFEGSYYRCMPGAADPRAAWIFEGIDDEILGDFGMSGGGAAGFELDRADFELGTPADALIPGALRSPSEPLTLWCPRNC